MKINSFLVKTDRIFDYIPVFSTVTNLIDIFQKCVILPLMSEEKIKNNHYYTHVKEKNLARCISLLIPVIGNILIALLDVSLKLKIVPEKVKKEDPKNLRQINVQGINNIEKQLDYDALPSQHNFAPKAIKEIRPIAPLLPSVEPEKHIDVQQKDMKIVRLGEIYILKATS